MPVHYPFSAVLGCDPTAPDGLDDMGLALVLTAVSPAIGGVLIRGEKGTAKSTTVRALAAVLPPVEVVVGDRFSVDPAVPAELASSPDAPFADDAARVHRPARVVELPIGASEDRVVGALDLEAALSRGGVEFEPGLLARAHRGVLYVDEVNLLHDHLVDLLLDAAATGRVSIERDGVSVEHAARFVLIGTMNPEEGELRPQLLDRFGLTVEVAAPRDPALRAEVVRRRMAFDADPSGFTARFADADADVAARILAARAALDRVELSTAALLKIAEICAAFEVEGLRADLVLARTAIAHAAWHERTAVTREDLRRAALLALPHRRRRLPFEEPGLDEQLLDALLGDDDPPPDEPPPGEGGEPEGAEPGEPGAEPAEPGEPGPADGDPAEAEVPAGAPVPTTTQRAQAPYASRLLRVEGLGTGTPGRRSRARGERGRRVGARPVTGTVTALDLPATIRAAASAQPGRGRGIGDPLRLARPDVRSAVREGREANLVLLCVDASGSMAARRRMEQVKTAVLSLLLDAYRRRDRIGLVTFRGTGAEETLPPTGSVDVAAARLDDLPAGGRTPLAEGLHEAARVVVRERRRDAGQRPLLVVVTDGRATAGADAVARSRMAADHLRALGVATVVVDSESGPMRLGLARDLAARLGAQHLPLAEVSAAALAGVVRARVA
ncbi:putative cobaltochelatase [Nocardioides fonticola]|uniref:Mg-protoporphyrin IX chelatase n=1 Tax=Nocardioides fonticola TaxID=450363 RepID=A0ABP7XWN1_9ACTN